MSSWIADNMWNEWNDGKWDAKRGAKQLDVTVTVGFSWGQWEEFEVRVTVVEGDDDEYAKTFEVATDEALKDADPNGEGHIHHTLISDYNEVEIVDWLEAYTDDDIEVAFNKWASGRIYQGGKIKVTVAREVDYGQQASDEPYYNEVYVTVDYLDRQTDDPDSQETFRAVLAERDGEEYVDFEEV